MDNNGLSNSDLQNFYAYLLLYENEIHEKESTVELWETDEFNSYCNANNIEKKYEKRGANEPPKNDFFRFNKLSKSKKEKPKRSYTYSFLKHIRDAFAHGKISMTQNVYEINNQYTNNIYMYAKIDVQKFWGMIEILTSNRFKVEVKNK